MPRAPSGASARLRYFVFMYAAATALFYVTVLALSPPGAIPRWAGGGKGAMWRTAETKPAIHLIVDASSAEESGGAAVSA